MHKIITASGRFRAPAPAVLLLALCLLAVGAQAADAPSYVVGDVLEIGGAEPPLMVIVADVDTTSLPTPTYTTFTVGKSWGRWEISRYWHGDLAYTEEQLVENLQARRFAHVDPVRVIITDPTITGGDMLYYGLSLAEARSGVLYAVEPPPGGVSGYPNTYVVGDILGNVSDPNRGAVVSRVYDADGSTWYRVYFDAVRSGDRWLLDRFYNNDMAFTWSYLDQNGMRRVAHADPHTVIIDDTTTNTGEIGWYRLSLAEFLAGKGYDHMGAWHFNTGDILGNGTASRYIIGNATVSDSGPSHYTLYQVQRSGNGWEIPAWVNAGIPLETPPGVQLDGIPYDLVDHTDPHFAVVIDPAVENGVTFNGLSLGEILEGTPGSPVDLPPLGGDTGYFLVSTAPAGAAISLVDISGTQYPVGDTASGPLYVTVHLTATPIRSIVANLTGYRDAIHTVTQYPARGETLPVSLTLEPLGGTSYKPLAVPGTIQAEDYDLGGESVAYHDTTSGNTGGAYRADDVDIETANGVTNVGWIRDGEWLRYTVNVTQGGDYYLALRVASPISCRWVAVSVDNAPQEMWVQVPKTGSFSTFATAVEWEPRNGPTPDPTGTITPLPTSTVIPDRRHPVRLAAGMHTLKLAFHGDGQNLDWLELTPYVPPMSTPNGTPYKPLAIPGAIQAEDYNLCGESVAYHDTTTGNSGGAYRNDDVDIESQGSVTNVGWIRNGEYLTYTATVASAGEYTMTARVSSPNSGRSIAVSVDGAALATVAVPNTGSFATFRTVAVPVTLDAGAHTLKLAFSGDGQNLDWFELSPYVEPTPTPTVTPTPTPEIDGRPFTPLAIPGTIQAEDYDLGGEGVASHDTTAGNEGGAYRRDDVDIEKQAGLSTPNVGWIRDGEYLRYTVNVAETGDYYLALRVASPHSYRNVVVSVDDGWQEMWVLVPNTGSFERFATAVEWSTRTRPSAGVTATMTPAPTATGLPFGKNRVHLTAGTHTLRLAFSGDGQNLDCITFEPVGATPTPTPTPEAGGASFSAVPTTAPYGTAVKFTVMPAGGKAIASAWWSFDATSHLNTWNSRTVNPTFYYPAAGTFSPLVRLTYTDGSTETVQRANYVTGT